jgi:hypothetical protein
MFYSNHISFLLELTATRGSRAMRSSYNLPLPCFDTHAPNDINYFHLERNK